MFGHRKRPSIPSSVDSAPARIATLLVLLVCFAAGAAIAQPKLNDGPLIRFADRQVDFGDLPQATRVTHDFQFENQGTEPLVITNVESSCGCTVAAPTDSLIPPGGSSSIEIAFSSKDFEGEVQKVVAVYTNDPGEPRIDLAVRANIIPFIRLETDWIDFGLVEVGTRPTAGALVTADPGTEFAIESVEGGDSFVDWEVIPASAGSGEIAYRLEATLKENAPYGRFAERIVMNVQHPNRQLRRIGLRGQVYSYFVVAGNELKFNAIKKGKIVTRSFDVGADRSKPYEITDVILDNPHLSPSVESTADGYRIDIVLDTTGIEFEGTRHVIEEFARVVTTDPRQEELVIKVTGVIRK